MRQIEKDINENSMGKLILKYSVPGILSGIVSALYNIVDQIFIGQSVGMIGNAATNVAFPLVTLCLATALLFGIGSAANFSLCLGRKEIDKAEKYVGCGLSSLVFFSIIICVLALLNIDSMLWFFGATEQNFALAKEYVSITSYAIPCYIFATGTTQLIRADGSPKKAMFFVMIGAILNCILDPIFIFGLNMGISGAALATAISQTVSAAFAFSYFFKFKTFKIRAKSLIPEAKIFSRVAAIGVAAATNQITIMIVQILMNNTLTYYGANSIYGSDIPLACVGVISKVNVIYVAISVGLGQGAQPIIGFNYGAKNYDKVMEAYKKCVLYVSVISVLVFIAFQVFPRQIISIFGSGSEEYYTFAVQYFRIFMFMVFLNGFNPITANFFTSLGKATRGMFMALTKQMIFLVPLIIILPLFYGIDGVLYAGPIADFAAFALSMTFVYFEFKNLKKLSAEQKK